MRFRLIIMLLAVAISASVFIHYRKIERAQESGQRIPAILGYAGSVLLAFLLFPGHPEIGMSALAILAFGDGTASLGGLLLGGHRLPWNHEKTAVGTLCFVLFGIPMAALSCWGEALNPLAPAHLKGLTLLMALSYVTPVVLLGALLESLPSRINDNIRVGCTAVICLAGIHLLRLQ